MPQCHLSSFCHLNDLTTYNETRLGEMCLELELKKKKKCPIDLVSSPNCTRISEDKFQGPTWYECNPLF